MKTGKTLQELALELTRQNHSKRDFLIDSSLISMQIPKNEIPNLVLGKNGSAEEFGINRLGHAQLSSKLGIPKKYYDHLLGNHPELLAENVNELSLREPQKMLVRTLDGNARAFLSDRYRTIDNYDLANAILPPLVELKKHQDLEIASSEVTETKLYIKVLFPTITGEIKQGDIVRAGLVISNSEVGQGSLRVERLVEILRCLNGLILPASLRKYHVGRKQQFAELDEAVEVFSDRTKQLDDMALFSKVIDVVKAAFNIEEFQKQIEAFKDTANNKVEKEPVEFIEISAKKYGLAQDEKNDALKHYLTYGDFSQYGLMNAITSAAQEESVGYDRSIELEHIGANVLDMDPSQWETLATA